MPDSTLPFRRPPDRFHQVFKGLQIEFALAYAAGITSHPTGR
jgi:hypothetical protein